MNRTCILSSWAFNNAGSETTVTLRTFYMCSRLAPAGENERCVSEGVDVLGAISLLAVGFI